MGHKDSAKSKLRTRCALFGICFAGCVVVTYDADGRIARLESSPMRTRS
jgi:hypothetical protein